MSLNWFDYHIRFMPETSERFLRPVWWLLVAVSDLTAWNLQLRTKEIKRDAEDLEDQAYLETSDTSYRIRKVRCTTTLKSSGSDFLSKLMRAFHDLMMAPTLESDEECPICMTEMKLKGAKRWVPASQVER